MQPAPVQPFTYPASMEYGYSMYWMPPPVMPALAPPSMEETVEEAPDTSLIESFPFSSHLDSNYIPSDQEVVEIRAFLKDPAKQLEDMKAEMDRLQAELDVLQKKQGYLQYQFTSCSALVSLARRLPDDILREIFFQTLPTNSNAIMHTDFAPLLFTRICKHWRHVALTTPLLWSTIHIPVIREEAPGRSPQSSPKFTEEEAIERAVQRGIAISRWFQRSGAAPLHISLFGSWQISSAPSIFFEKYIESVLPFALRWKSLSLSGSYTYYNRVSSIAVTDLPLLEALFLDLHQDSPMGSEDMLSSWNNSGLFRSPSLLKLSIRPPIQHIRNFEVDWSQLTHLALGGGKDYHMSGFYLSMGNISTILQPCSRLIDCVLGVKPNYYTSEFENICSVYLPSLRRLSIQEDTNALPLIEKIEAPNLQEIIFHSTVPEGDVSLPALVAQTHETVRKLTVDSVFLSHTAFINCLLNCPDLTFLSVKKTSNIGYDYRTPQNRPELSIDDHLLDFLITEGCPRLEMFNCHFPANFSFEGMMSFIQRKQDGQDARLAKLKNISIRYTFPQGQETVPWGVRPEMKKYIDAGLSFNYNYSAHWQSRSAQYFRANEGIPYDFLGSDDDDLWRWRDD